MLKENKLLCKSAMMFYTTDHGYSNANMTHRRRNRTRKFNLNMSWYGTLYKRIKGSQKMWTLHHNPLHGKLLFLSVRVVHMICLNNSYTLTKTHKISLQGKAWTGNFKTWYCWDSQKFFLEYYYLKYHLILINDTLLSFKDCMSRQNVAFSAEWFSFGR